MYNNHYVEFINAILVNHDNKTFISKALKSVSTKNREHDHINYILKNWLIDILDRNIKDKYEMYRMIKELVVLMPDIDSSINFDAEYSNELCYTILSRMSSDSILAELNPILEEVNTLRRKIPISGSTIERAKMVKSFHKMIEDLANASREVKVSDEDSLSNILIFDPLSEDDKGTFNVVQSEIRNTLNSRIKSINWVDDLTGGGFIVGGLYINAAIGGNFKSGFAQNVLLYASKNNKPEDFDHILLDKEKYKPCLFFISRELSFRQMMERHLNWFDPSITQDKLKDLTEEQLKNMSREFNIREGMSIPIIYKDRKKEEGTTVLDIEGDIRQILSNGYQPVMVVVDYIDRIEVADASIRSYGKTGHEGSISLQQKGLELKKLSERWNCAILTPAQLGGKAQEKQTELKPFSKVIDKLYQYGINMLAGSTSLQRELDLIVFTDLVEIDRLNESEGTITKDKYVALRCMKDRDNVSRYRKSERDIESEAAYNSYTTRLMNNGRYSEMIKITGDYHIVVKMNGFRLSENDYSTSIRKFYHDERSNFVSLENLMNNQEVTDIEEAEFF